MPRMSILTANEKVAVESPPSEPDRSLPGSTSTGTESTISRARSWKIRSVWKFPKSVSSLWAETGSTAFGKNASGGSDSNGAKSHA